MAQEGIERCLTEPYTADSHDMSEKDVGQAEGGLCLSGGIKIEILLLI